MCKLRDDTMSQAGELPIEMTMKKPKHMPHPRLAMDAALTAAARAVLEHTKAAAIHLPISEGMSVYLGADAEIAKMLETGSAAVRGEAVAIPDSAITEEMLDDEIIGLPCNWRGDPSQFMTVSLGHTMACEQAAILIAKRKLVQERASLAAPVSPRAADAPSEPSRADLEAIDRAMQHMGDALNALDLADEDDEKITSDGFAAIARLLESRAADALDSQPAPAIQAGIGEDARFNELVWDIAKVDEHRWMRDRIAELVAYIDSRASAAPAASVAGWISVDDRLPAVGELVAVYSPLTVDDWPGSINIELDCIDEIDDSHSSWAGHNNHYEHFCCVVKPEGTTGPSEKAPYTHWAPLPPPPQQEGSEAGNG